MVPTMAIALRHGPCKGRAVVAVVHEDLSLLHEIRSFSLWSCRRRVRYLLLDGWSFHDRCRAPARVASCGVHDEVEGDW
jgi:hypothetical protein